MKILLTGGVGFIGSHVAVELLSREYEIVLFDNFVNSYPEIIPRIEKLGGAKVHFVQGDIRNIPSLDKLFRDFDIEAVFHFAALKSVVESNIDPLNTFDVNVAGLLNLLKAMDAAGCRKIYYSSSATVYAPNQCLPLTELAQLGPVNSYGVSKLMGEQLLQELSARGGWKVGIFRYFNPAGAHSSGYLGEMPKLSSKNLFSAVLDVINGKEQALKIFGDDYPTVDGSGVRDYCHIEDIVRGHVLGLEVLETQNSFCVNLGRGYGTSVLEVIRMFESIVGHSIPYQIFPRRSGDLAEYFCDTSKAKEVLVWQAEKNLRDMCEDALRWNKVVKVAKNKFK